MTRPVLGSRALFPDLEARAYLNHAAVSPPSQPVQAAVAQWMSHYGRLGLGAVHGAMEQRAALKSRVADLLGCAASDVALSGSTNRGLLDLSSCIPFKTGDRILCFDGEFPANITTWMCAAQATGALVERLPQAELNDADLLSVVERALNQGGVRLIAVSAVQFSTGRAMPLKGLCDLAHAHGAEVCVDAIQALGVMPLNVVELGIDYLATGGHKWLMGIEGVGFVYAAPHRVSSLNRRIAGWLSHENPVGFLLDGPGHLDYDRPFRDDIGFLEGHSMSVLGCVAVEAGIQLIQALGVPQIQAHVRAYNDALEVGLVQRGFTSLRLPGSPAGTLSVLPPKGATSVAWTERFNAAGISMSGPDGKLRFSPHWPNALDEVSMVLDVIDG
ncbi:MAG: aminotransferase class V-fold PLP-dependent enzyme [Rhodobacterales bacterium]|nr:aminotransferase class V-fold PLP-dependent enzyme [Rhodobacterales bacterium]